VSIQPEPAFAWSSSLPRALCTVSLGLFGVWAVHCSNCRMLTSCVVFGTFTLTASRVTAPGSIPSVHGCRRNSLTPAPPLGLADGLRKKEPQRYPDGGAEE